MKICIIFVPLFFLRGCWLRMPLVVMNGQTGMEVWGGSSGIQWQNQRKSEDEVPKKLKRVVYCIFSQLKQFPGQII